MARRHGPLDEMVEAAARRVRAFGWLDMSPGMRLPTSSGDQMSSWCRRLYEPWAIGRQRSDWREHGARRVRA